MDVKEVLVTCPCCESRLAVDVRTSKVVRWSAAQEQDEGGKQLPHDFDQVQKRVEGRLGTALDKFDGNLAREKRRGRDLDDLFEKANEKLKEEDDE